MLHNVDRSHLHRGQISSVIFFLPQTSQSIDGAGVSAGIVLSSINPPGRKRGLQGMRCNWIAGLFLPTQLLRVISQAGLSVLQRLLR